MKNESKFKRIKCYLKNIFLLSIGIAFLLGCSKDKEYELGLDSISTHELNEQDVKLIAENFFKNSNATSKGINNSKTIKDITEHKTSQNNSAFYVINYDQGGFIIIASDDRISPILAFSDNGTFSSEQTKIISPVLYWIETVKSNIQSTINNNEKQSENVKLEWEVLSLKNNTLTKKQIPLVE